MTGNEEWTDSEAVLKMAKEIVSVDVDDVLNVESLLKARVETWTEK